MDIEEIIMGVRYQPLGDPTASEEVGIYRRHWVLVFTGQEFTFTIEAGVDPEAQKDLVMQMKPCPRTYQAFRLGTFRGRWSDLRAVLRTHPQRGTAYSAIFNNCQHFVAIYLLFLNAYGNQARGRYFSIDEGSRHARINAVLVMSERQICNNPSRVLGALYMAAGATSVGIAVSVTDSAAPVASALAGWLGSANAHIIPTALRNLTQLSVPIAIGCAGLAGGVSLLKSLDWDQKTLFENPLVVGYPLEPARSLRFEDLPMDWDTMGKIVSNSKNSSVDLVSAVIAEAYFSSPGFSNGTDPHSLFELAGKLIR